MTFSGHDRETELLMSCWSVRPDGIAVIDEARLAQVRRELPVHCWAWPVTAAGLEHAAEIQAAADLAVDGAALYAAFCAASSLLARWQQDRCAICGGRGHLLDHDHETALIRGWVCRSCNHQEPYGAPEGRFGRYRARHPAVMLGIRVPHFNRKTGWAVPSRPAAG